MRTAPSATTQVSLAEVTKRYDDRVVLDRVTFTVKPGEKIGVIGENGSGKSTLLRLIAGRESPDNGEVTVSAPGGAGYLPQVLEQADGTVGDVVDLALARLRDLEARLHEAEAALGPAATARQLAAYGELQGEFEARGGYEADARVDIALHGLGLPRLDRDRPVATLSGGELGRLMLAATLAAAPELLLLDEPTNDLDDQAMAWLEDYLRGHHGTVVAITHDRAFLEAITTTILEVDHDTATVRRYGDGYRGYLAAKAAARARWERARRDWLAEVDRQRRLVTVGGAQLATISRKGPRSFSGSGSHRPRSSSTGTANRVRNAGERLRRLRAHPVPPPPEPLRLAARIGTHAGPAEVELTDVVVGGRLHLDGLHLEPGARLLVTGPNGAGKTTLLRVLAGELAPDAGTVRRPSEIGYLRQEGAAGRPGQTVLEAFAAGRPGPADEHAAALLALGLFRAADLGVRMGELSVGQRRRVELARLMTEPADLLLLDEPTNHLSPALAEELEGALAAFTGTLVMVTHDRRLRSVFTGSRLHLLSGGRAPTSLAA